MLAKMLPQASSSGWYAAIGMLLLLIRGSVGTASGMIELFPTNMTTTIAGKNGSVIPVDNVAATLSGGSFIDVTGDLAGNLYFADMLNGRIRMMDQTGTITTLLAVPNPRAVSMGTANELLVATASNIVSIQKVNNSYLSTTIIGGGPSMNDGIAATFAKLDTPNSIVMQTNGDYYVADAGFHNVRFVRDGTISTVAGVSVGVGGFSGDGAAATGAALWYPLDVALGSASTGTFYIADSGNHRVRKVTNGIITTFAGNGIAVESGDSGLATSASMVSPSSLIYDIVRSILYIGTENRIRKVNSAGIISTLVGGGLPGGFCVPALAIMVQSVTGMFADMTGLYYTDFGQRMVRSIGSSTACVSPSPSASGTSSLSPTPSLSVSVSGTVTASVYPSPTCFSCSILQGWDETDSLTVIAGNATLGTTPVDNVPGTLSGGSFRGITGDGMGNLYVVDSVQGIVRVLNASGIISTLFAFSGMDPWWIAFVAPSSILVSMHLSGVVVLLGPGGMQVVAGGGGSTQDNIPATFASLANPQGIAVISGNIFLFAESSRHKIRCVNNGNISTWAGTGISGYGGDNGLATSARLAYPTSVTLASANKYYIADMSNHVIRMVTNGIISTVAGNSTPGHSGDGGLATLAQLVSPTSVVYDAANGALYIAETLYVRKVSLVTGVISTLTGNAVPSTGGSCASAGLQSVVKPYSMYADRTGLYFSDVGSQYIYAVGSQTCVSATPSPSITASASQLPSVTVSASRPASVSASRTVTPSRSHTVVLPSSTGTPSTSTSYTPSITPSPLCYSIACDTRVYTGNDKLAIFAGNGEPLDASVAEIPATSSGGSFLGIAGDGAGTVYLADSSNNRIRKVFNGSISTVVRFGSVASLAMESANTLLVADSSFSAAIYRLDVRNGNYTIIAGQGDINELDFVPPLLALIQAPIAVASAGYDRYYIAETGAHRIRMVSGGLLFTVAGTGDAGFLADYIMATDTYLNTPLHVTAGYGTSFYIADTGNHRVRYVDMTGLITTKAGNGTGGLYGGDFVTATAVAIDSPSAIAYDLTHNTLYVVEGGRIRRIDAEGEMSTITGHGLHNVPMCIPALLVGGLSPYNMYVDNSGFYVTDPFAHVAYVIGSPTCTPSMLPSKTATSSVSMSLVPSPTMSLSPSALNTPSVTPLASPLMHPSFTSSASSTDTGTASLSATTTGTYTPSFLPSIVAPSVTSTSSSSASISFSSTFTMSISSSSESSAVPVPSSSSTSTSSHSLTPVASPSSGNVSYDASGDGGNGIVAPVARYPRWMVILVAVAIALVCCIATLLAMHVLVRQCEGHGKSKLTDNVKALSRASSSRHMTSNPLAQTARTSASPHRTSMA
jgi:hypothetical protein